MADIESSGNESPDIDEYVSMAYKKFTEDSLIAQAESLESPVLSLVMSDQFGRKDYISQKSNTTTDMIWFVSLS